MKSYKYLILIAIILAPAFSAADSLMVYSGRKAKFLKPVMKAFEKKTGIKVKLHSAKASGLINRMRLEGAKTRADAFISNDAGSLQIGSDMDLFQKIDPKAIEKIKTNYRAADGTWVGLSARIRVLVVNKKFLDEAKSIKSIFDLAKPKYRGKVAVTHSANGSFISGITVYAKLAGDKKTLEFLRGLKANTAGKVYNKHSDIVRDVAAGKKMIGLVNHYYVYRHLAKHKNAAIQILIPDQGEKDMGVALNITGIAISKYTKKKAAVDKLIEFLLSDEGQSLFALQNREYPIRDDVKASPEIPPANSFRAANVPMAVLGKEQNKTLKLIENVGFY